MFKPSFAVKLKVKAKGQFSKKTHKKFDEFLPKNLKSGQMKKIKALYNVK